MGSLFVTLEELAIGFRIWAEILATLVGKVGRSVLLQGIVQELLPSETKNMIVFTDEMSLSAHGALHLVALKNLPVP